MKLSMVFALAVISTFSAQACDDDKKDKDMPPQTLLVELLYANKPVVDKARLLARLKKICPDIVTLDGKSEEGLLAFVHPKHVVQYKDAKLPAQFCVFPTKHEVNEEDYAELIQQSWNNKDAKKLVGRCKHSLLVTEMLAQGLPRQQRVELFQKCLKCVVEETKPTVMAWKTSQQLITPDEYVKQLAEQPLFGIVNVRMFRIQNSEGDIVMDSVGLTIFGLPDMQCHFKKLDSGDVGAMLYNTALYLFDKGDVIQDGHTVQGLTPADKWKCQHEESLVKPKREVLDVNPGAPHAAGKRK